MQHREVERARTPDEAAGQEPCQGASDLAQEYGIMNGNHHLFEIFARQTKLCTTFCLLLYDGEPVPERERERADSTVAVKGARVCRMHTSPALMTCCLPRTNSSTGSGEVQWLSRPRVHAYLGLPVPYHRDGTLSEPHPLQ